MANYIDVPFIIQQGQGRSTSQGQQIMQNVYGHTVKNNEGGKKKYNIFSTPGLTQVADSGQAEGRGIWEQNGILYAVFGNTFYSIDSSFNLTALGTLNTSSGYVQMNDGVDQIVMIDGTNGYNYQISTATFTVVASNFPSTTKTVCYIDGYFVSPEYQTNLFQISSNGDFKTWAALDFASAEGNADNIISIFCVNRQVWILGEKTSEVWFDAGNADFPLQRIEGAFSEFGIAARYSVAKVSDSLMWLSKTSHGGLKVIKVNQLQPQPVSTQDIDKQLADLTTVYDAEAFSYEQEGHEFYVLTFPTAGKTFVYDVTEDLWHVRVSTLSGVDTRWQIRNYAFCRNKHVAISFNDGKLYTIDTNSGSENGTAIKRKFRGFPLYQNRYRVTINQLVLDTEKSLDSGSTASVNVAVSRDGGYSFDATQTEAASRHNDFVNPVIWRGLGISSEWVLEFTTSDALPWVFLGINIDATIAKS